MKLSLLTTLLVSSLVSVVLGYGWSPEDQEIFRVRNELELAEGEGITFYDFIGVTKGPSASIEDINKAYKKTSIRYHPDKHRPLKGLNKREIAAAKKKAQERFTRLGIVVAVLRGPERDRYDHFLKNGFPKWRGTGYYYTRFRPGLGTVIVGMWLAAGVAHYGILVLNGTQQRKHIQQYINDARKAAGVPGLAEILPEPKFEDSDAEPQPRNRKERRAMQPKKSKASATSAPVPGVATPADGGRKKVFAENGRPLIVDGVGNVYLQHQGEDGTEELLLDVNEVEGAKWKNTCLITLPKFFWRISVGRFIPEPKQVDVVEAEHNNNEGGLDGESSSTPIRGVAKRMSEARKRGANKNRGKK